MNLRWGLDTSSNYHPVFKQQLTAPISSADKSAQQHKLRYGIGTPTQEKQHLFRGRLRHLWLHPKCSGVHIICQCHTKNCFPPLTLGQTSQTQGADIGFGSTPCIIGCLSPLSYWCLQLNCQQTLKSYLMKKKGRLRFNKQYLTFSAVSNR